MMPSPLSGRVLTISVDRSGMDGSPAALAFSGRLDGTARGVTSYDEPAMIPRNRYATSSDYEDGDEIRGTTWQQSVLGWSFITPGVASEQEHRTLVAEVREAVSQLRFDVTVAVDGADAETWRCNRGTLTAVAGRTLVDVAHHTAEWSIVLPCNPVRTIA
jgi:hypothetical protein